jgi:hypothetical protein
MTGVIVSKSRPLAAGDSPYLSSVHLSLVHIVLDCCPSSHQGPLFIKACHHSIEVLEVCFHVGSVGRPALLDRGVAVLDVRVGRVVDVCCCAGSREGSLFGGR